MKKKILVYALSALTCGLFTSCSDWLDINHDPNTAEKVDPGYLFNYAAVNWAGTRTGGDFYIPLSMSSQCQVDGGLDYGGWDESVYTISPYSTGNVWKHYYSVGGNNLMLAIKNAEESDPVNHNAIAQCKILLAEHMYEATMLWGDIPFTESWNGTIKYPKFDSQESVLNGVLSLLDEALQVMDLNDANAIDEYDIYYKGDMNKWMTLAKSLKFRTLMVMVDKDPSKATAIGTMLQAGGMVSSASDNLVFPYSTDPGNQNPKYELIELVGGTQILFFASNYMLKPMQERKDPRIPCYFEPGADGVYRGLGNREPAETDDKDNMLSSVVSSYLFRKDAPELIYSCQEQLLLEAEAYARGLGVAQNLSKANELYKKGVREACAFYGVAENDIDTYVTGLPELTTVTPENALYEIHMQQWIDLMDRPFEEFVQWRRSGTAGNEVPTLQVPEDATSKELIRRWEYSPEEMTANINAPKESPKIWEKLWFDL